MFFRNWIVAALVSVIALTAESRAQDKPLKKLSYGVSTLSANLWIPWLAKEAKIFDKNGLDVDTVLFRGSGQTSQAMAGGHLFAASVALNVVESPSSS